MWKYRSVSNILTFYFWDLWPVQMKLKNKTRHGFEKNRRRLAKEKISWLFGENFEESEVF